MDRARKFKFSRYIHPPPTNKNDSISLHLSDSVQCTERLLFSSMSAIFDLCNKLGC